ncbi:MAG: sporulation initiation inhibitor Soj [Candidatus Dojkabacteria bacterium]|nr:MAG: sporulation initiation inhibitor Soj [Candidatus Dojkabacteria bacterium]
MIVVFANQKGGVGKTTTTASIASILAKQGKKVLAIDIDPQSNLTSGFGFDKSRDYLSIYEVLVHNIDVAEVFVVSDINENLHLIPSKIDLAGAEIELVSRFSREKILKEKLESVKNVYDYILIDSPPSLGLLTLNALVASDGVVIPVQCEYYALEGISQLVKTVDLVKKSINNDLEIFGVVMTMFDARTRLSSEVVIEVKNFFGTKVFDTIIPRNVRISESPSYGKPIDLYDPASIGAKAYEKLTQEFIERMSKYGRMSNYGEK